MRKRTLLFSALLLLLSACGKKGPLLPPIPRLPKPPEQLRLFQQGQALTISWRNPTAYIDGRPLEVVEAVEIWMWGEPRIPDKALAAVDMGTFRDQAGLLSELGPSRLAELTSLDDSEERITRYRHIFDSADIGTKRYAVALKVRDADGRTSEFTGIAVYEPKLVPLPPGGLSAKVEQSRIRLEWQAPEKNIDASVPPVLKGYTVYRADGDGPFLPINPSLLTETAFDDTNFVFGEEYLYVVRSAANVSPPLLESVDSEPLSVEARDNFAPAPPTGLTLIAGEDYISLSWRAGSEKDLAGYRVWKRRKSDPEYVPLTTEAISATSYLDKNADKNVTYEYAVTALDRSGNESPMSKPAEGVIYGRRP